MGAADGPVNRTEPFENLSENDDFENVSILVLRLAKNFVVPLRLPGDWESLPRAPIATPTGEFVAVPSCRLAKRMSDPAGNQTRNVIISIEPSLIDERIRVFIESDAIPQEHTWRAALADVESRTLANIPLTDTELHKSLPYGSYTLTISSQGAPLDRLKFFVEPFSLPEAIETAQSFLSHRQYIRADAVLTDAAERFPDNSDAQDLLVLAQTLATVDPAGYQKEQSEFGVTRSLGDAPRRLHEFLASTKAKFGNRMASIFAARSLDRTAIPDEVIKKIAQETASMTVLHVMGAMKEHLIAREDALKDHVLVEVLNSVTERLGQMDVLRQELRDHIDVVRNDVLKNTDEKFGLVCDALERFDNAVANVPTTPPDYAPFFRERLGDACWNWIEAKYQKIFIAAENRYRSEMNKPTDSTELTEALLQYCRALEFLLNDKLGRLCSDIQNLVSKNSKFYNFALEKLSAVDELELAVAEHGSLSMTKIAALLHVGKVIELGHPGTLGSDSARVLACSPGPADIEQIAILCYTAVKLRNGKTHRHSITKPRELKLLRKLALGLDEEGVGQYDVQAWLNKHNSWFENEADEIRTRLAQNWHELPGFVPLVWRAITTAAASSTAA